MRVASRLHPARSTHTAAALLAATGLLAAAPPTSAASLDALYVFGDSYSDNGNLYALISAPPSPPYARRYTDGPTAVEYLAQGLGIPFTYSLDPNAGGKSLSFAVSGALTGTASNTPAVSGTTGMLNQVADFKGRVDAGTVSFEPGKTLFFLLGGGNDILRTTFYGSDPARVVPDAVANLTNEVQTLAGLGAKHIAIGTEPDFGETPYARQAGVGAQLSALSASLDDAYRTLAPSLAGALGADVFVLDWGGYLDALVSDPAAHGFADATSTCLTDAGAVCADPSGHVFWDGVHPTTAAHRAIGAGLTGALSAFGQIATGTGDGGQAGGGIDDGGQENGGASGPAAMAVPEPVSAALLGIGLAGLGLARRRREAA